MCDVPLNFKSCSLCMFEIEYNDVYVRFCLWDLCNPILKLLASVLYCRYEHMLNATMFFYEETFYVKVKLY